MELRHWRITITIAIAGLLLFLGRGIAQEAGDFLFFVRFVVVDLLNDEMVRSLLAIPLGVVGVLSVPVIVFVTLRVVAAHDAESLRKTEKSRQE